MKEAETKKLLNDLSHRDEQELVNYILRDTSRRARKNNGIEDDNDLLQMERKDLLGLIEKLKPQLQGKLDDSEVQVPTFPTHD